MLLELFQDQVRDQCRFVLFAYAAAESALVELDEAWDEAGARDATAEFRARVEAQGDARDYEAVAQEMAAETRVRHEARRAAMDRVWFSLQNLVIAAANVSKALWGSNKQAAARRTDLRQSLNVNDDSPLFPPRTMRDHFEHYDERLEEWDAKSVNHWHIDRNLGSFASAMSPPADRLELFRNYDPNTEVVTFWGDDFDIPAIVAEVDRILGVLSSADRRAHRGTP
jgi:hypothetical protein